MKGGRDFENVGTIIFPYTNGSYCCWMYRNVVMHLAELILECSRCFLHLPYLFKQLKLCMDLIHIHEWKRNFLITNIL